MAGETVFLGSPASFGAVVFASQTVTSTIAGSKIPGMEKYTSADFFAKVSSVSGTTPTFDIAIQSLMADGTTWQSIGNFAQITGTANNYFHKVIGADETAATATALSAGSFAKLGLGCFIRVNIVVGGSTPSGVIAVYANFYE